MVIESAKEGRFLVEQFRQNIPENIKERNTYLTKQLVRDLKPAQLAQASYKGISKNDLGEKQKMFLLNIIQDFSLSSIVNTNVVALKYFDDLKSVSLSLKDYEKELGRKVLYYDFIDKSNMMKSVPLLDSLAIYLLKRNNPDLNDRFLLSKKYNSNPETIRDLVVHLNERGGAPCFVSATIADKPVMVFGLRYVSNEEALSSVAKLYGLHLTFDGERYIIDRKPTPRPRSIADLPGAIATTIPEPLYRMMKPKEKSAPTLSYSPRVQRYLLDMTTRFRKEKMESIKFEKLSLTEKNAVILFLLKDYFVDAVEYSGSKVKTTQDIEGMYLQSSESVDGDHYSFTLFRYYKGEKHIGYSVNSWRRKPEPMVPKATAVPETFKK